MSIRLRFATTYSLIASIFLTVILMLILVLGNHLPTENWKALMFFVSAVMILFFLALTAVNYFFARKLLNPIQKVKEQVKIYIPAANPPHYTDELAILEEGIATVFEKLKRQYHELSLINDKLKQRNEDIKQLMTHTIAALAKAVHTRDPYTASHSENVMRYASAVAKKLQLNNEEVYCIEIGALLHDIGKIGVPEHVLKKSGRLTDAEFEAIKQHPIHGYHIIGEIVEFKNNGIVDMVLYHHERMDGKGYPYGLKGDEIPLYARIISVCDAFDAMTTSRSYRPALDTVTAMEQLNQYAGTQFDEKIVAAFLECLRENPDLVKPLTMAQESRFVL